MVNACKSGGMCTPSANHGGKKHPSKKHSRSNKSINRHGTKKRSGPKKGKRSGSKKGKRSGPNKRSGHKKGTKKHRGGMGLAAAKTAAVPFGLLGLQKWFQKSRSRK